LLLICCWFVADLLLICWRWRCWQRWRVRGNSSTTLSAARQGAAKACYWTSCAHRGRRSLTSRDAPPIEDPSLVQE
jgi:hypothetical protein